MRRVRGASVNLVTKDPTRAADAPGMLDQLDAGGVVRFPHQAGIAVYERAPTGLLAAARLHDDVDRPSPIN